VLEDYCLIHSLLFVLPKLDRLLIDGNIEISMYKHNLAYTTDERDTRVHVSNTAWSYTYLLLLGLLIPVVLAQIILLRQQRLATPLLPQAVSESP
jgi:hypothetical protein